MQKPPQYNLAESYSVIMRDVLAKGVKVITCGVRPNLADLPNHPYETYVTFGIDGDYDCGTVHHRDWRKAIKYHNAAVKTLKEAIHA